MANKKKVTQKKNFDWGNELCSPWTGNKRMSVEEFENLVEERLEKVKALLLSKGDEYARNGDRLHNFHTGARKMDKTPQEVLKGFLLKHEISIEDLIEDHAKGKPVKLAQVEEKIGDAIVYYILLEVLFKE
jgi:hypothetical protein